MKRYFLRTEVAAIIAAACLAAGPLAGQTASAGSAPAATMSPADRARADGGRPPYTKEDLHFMQGMIAHHAQAIVMASWAPTHGARPDVARLCKKVDVAQRDEIATMQQWLRDRHETVPQPDFKYDSAGMAHMPGMSGGLMPGMLTPEQMAQLNAARGPDFDRLFLTFMIQHHEGALSMVQELMDTEGAGQDDTIFKFASDVNSDQTVEIQRMQQMLDAK